MIIAGSELQGHLEGGVTTLCRCWRVRRGDGVVFGFTDHDGTIGFDGTVFRASDGMSARAFDQSTGLSVDNSEALGVLSDAGVTEADILAGRYDGATIEAWLVNWQDPSQRKLLFRGEMGEIERAGGAFKAELRGLTETLNQPQGKVYQSPCAALLGDAACKVDLDNPRFARDSTIARIAGAELRLAASFGGLPSGWFERGRLCVEDGSGRGSIRVVREDRIVGDARALVLWDALPHDVAVGDCVRIEAGCDKRLETCHAKFANVVNYRGFPHLPGDDWLMAYPRRGSVE